MRPLTACALLIAAAVTFGCDSPRGPLDPAGTPVTSATLWTISGTVSDQDGGPIEGARIVAEPSLLSVLSLADGSFSINTRPATTLLLTSGDYDDRRVGVPQSAPFVVHARMRPSSIAGAESSLTLSLAPSDTEATDTQFGESWCEPCRPVKIRTAAATNVEVTVRWAAPTVLALWDPQRRAYWSATPGRTTFTARVSTRPGDTVVYVGTPVYVGPPLGEPMTVEIVTRRVD